MDYSQFKQLEFRRKFLKLFGAEISITDPVSNGLVGYIKMKAWKLREDVRLYSDSTMQREIMRIGARNIIDFGATYDIFDSNTNVPIYSMRRQGLKSTFVRDHWLLNDPNGNKFGDLIETSGNLALARRWLSAIFGDFVALIFMFVPQTYTLSVNDANGSALVVGQIVHRKNPFVVKMLLDTSMAQIAIDPRVNISAVALLSVIDASKS